MKFLKEKKGIIIAFIIGLIIASSITVYAYSYFASDISYTKTGTEIPISVETALNELYNLQNSTITKETKTVSGGSLSYTFENDYKAVCVLISDNDSRGSAWSTTCENSELLIEKTSPSDVFTFRYILLENVKKGNTISASHTENNWGINLKMILIK